MINCISTIVDSKNLKAQMTVVTALLTMQICRKLCSIFENKFKDLFPDSDAMTKASALNAKARNTDYEASTYA